MRVKEREAAAHAEQYAEQLREAGASREELAVQIDFLSHCDLLRTISE